MRVLDFVVGLLLELWKWGCYCAYKMWDEGAHVMWDEGAHVMWDEGAHVVSHLRRFEVLGGLLEPTFTSVPRFCLDPTLPTVHTINSDFLQLHKSFFRVQFQVCTMQIAVMLPLGSLKPS